MKATRNLGSWKALAFLTVIFSLFFLVGCQNDTPTVDTLSATVLDGGKAIQVTGQIISDGGADVYQKGFCLSTHALPTVSDIKKEALGTIANFTTTFNNLDQNVTYYVRAYAMNNVGIGYGEIIEVTTSTLALATTGDAEVLDTTEVILSATINALNSDVEIWFEVWRSGESIRRVELQKTGTQSEDEVIARATGLTPGEVYSYAVKVKNSLGTTTGETKSFRLPYEIVTDGDGNSYWTIKIGNQIWMAENLKTTHFLNGDPIPNIQPDNEWVAMKSPAYCYTKNDPELGKVYGALYNNYVGLDQRGLIEGYRTPTIQDYETLVANNGGGAIAPRKLKSATDDWYNGGKGDNSSGFNALPGGWRSWKEDPFSSLYYQAVFLTTTPMEGVGAHYDAMIYGSGYIMTIGASSQYLGRSIRLIKN